MPKFPTAKSVAQNKIPFSAYPTDVGLSEEDVASLTGEPTEHDQHLIDLEKEVRELRQLSKQTSRGQSAILFTMNNTAYFFVLEGNHFRYDDCFLEEAKDWWCDIKLEKEITRQAGLRKLLIDGRTSNHFKHKLASSELFERTIRRGAVFVNCGSHYSSTEGLTRR